MQEMLIEREATIKPGQYHSHCWFWTQRLWIPKRPVDYHFYELVPCRLASPFLVRSVDPPIQAADGKLVIGLRRLGKRVVWELEDSLFLVIH